MSSGEKPALVRVSAGTTRRSNFSASNSCLSAWRGVRPVSIRLSTATPALAARCSIVSSSGMACPHVAGIGASSAR